MMNWFEEQVRSRRQSDQDALNEAYEAAVNAVMGESFSFEEAEEEFTTILRYYHMSAVKIPDDIKDENEKLSSLCRLSGLMHRPIKLDMGWYKAAFGAFLCRFRDTNEYVAVIPGKMGGYVFYDKRKHKRYRVNRKTSQYFDEQAICFYRPLPNKKLNILEVVRFGLSAWSVPDYFFTIALMAISTLIGLLIPKLNFFLYSSVIDEGSVSLLLTTMIFVINVGVASLILKNMQSIFTTRSGVKMDTALESAIMMRTLSLPAAFFRKYSTGEIMRRMEYLQSISTKIVTMLFSTALSSLFSLAYVTQIFRYTPALVIPSLCIIFAQVIFTVYTSLRQMKIVKRQMELGAKNNGKSIEMISGIQKIKMSGSEKRMFARYAKGFAEEARMNYNPPFFHKYNNVISNAISYFGIVLMYYLTIAAQVNVAEYYAFQSAYAVISASITSLAGIGLELANLKPGLEMAKPMMDAVSENNSSAQEVTHLFGSIELNNVSFKYEENAANVIDDLSLTITPGQYVAVVGKTGCGKSTLVRLLLGFEKPQKGAIYYDGKDLNQLEIRSLRRKIGTVMQDDKLFIGDIYSNIVICSPSLSLARAWEAAEIAGIADDIRAMPMGMHTFISEGSGGISGGQMQRLAIARAIAPKPKILIFDEATSALDNITQKKVSDALDSLDCTRIVIAHRLSTIQHCDRILVMDKGRIIESGTYEELVAQNGIFAELVARQRLV